jgi:hypothetical protein
MGNMPLFCWGNEFEPPVDKEGFIIRKESSRSRREVVPVSPSNTIYRVSPRTFFLLTV